MTWGSRFTGLAVFSVLLIVLVDALIYCIDVEKTLSTTTQRILRGSPQSMRAAMLGFVVGALLVHFTQWGASV
jgi:hypothetical protein